MRKIDSKKQNENLKKLENIFQEITKSANIIAKNLKIINSYKNLNNYSNTSEPPLELLD